MRKIIGVSTALLVFAFLAFVQAQDGGNLNDRTGNAATSVQVPLSYATHRAVLKRLQVAADAPEDYQLITVWMLSGTKHEFDRATQVDHDTGSILLETAAGGQTKSITLRVERVESVELLTKKT